MIDGHAISDDYGADNYFSHSRHAFNDIHFAGGFDRSKEKKPTTGTSLNEFLFGF